jgi:PEGA domain
MQWMRMSGLIFVLAVAPQIARAQAAAAQAGSANSSSSVAATTEKEKTPAGERNSADRTPPPIMASTAKPSGTPTSAHLVAPVGPPPEEVNRKALEANAGPDAGKLLVRSTPSGAQVFVNDAYVGHSPMLLIVPPGNYRVEMRGGRLETGAKTVGILPKQTQEVALTLKQLYPVQVQMK